MSFEQRDVSDLDDGLYLGRMDDCFDAEEYEIKDGKAYKDGEHYIVIGYEWHKI